MKETKTGSQKNYGVERDFEYFEYTGDAATCMEEIVTDMGDAKAIVRINRDLQKEARDKSAVKYAFNDRKKRLAQEYAMYHDQENYIRITGEFSKGSKEVLDYLIKIYNEHCK